jgi:DNA-directed RNA polymerase specialized sigma24 family protein
MVDRRSLALDQLIHCCHTATVTYLRTHQAGDDSYCLELFRRAVQDHNESAWAFIYTAYSTDELLGEHYVLKWVRSWLNGRHGATIRSAFTEEEIVQEIWLRFSNSEAARTFNFESMSQLMSYMRRLINNFIMDVARRRAPQIIHSSTEQEAAHIEQMLRTVPDQRADGVDDLMAEHESLEELLQQIGHEIITNESEWLVFRSYFLERLPPRKLYALYPDRFAPGEVEIIRTRLVRRLRKSPFILNRYIQLVVLADEERLGLVFEHAILDGWTDEQLLERFPALFPTQADLLAAKVQIVEALHGNPTLLQLLHI